MGKKPEKASCSGTTCGKMRWRKWWQVMLPN